MWRWNDVTAAELRQMWSDGLTGGTISKAFHERYGDCPSRSAIMGKVRRLDLAKRKRFHGAVKAKRVVKPRGPHKPLKHVSIFDRTVGQPIPESQALPTSSPGPLLSLRSHDCRFPVDGEGATMLFCRDPQYQNFPYCLAHCRMAYRPYERKLAA